MKWNRFGTFDNYPPVFRAIIGVLIVHFVLDSEPNNSISINEKDFPLDGDLTLVIYYTYAFNKQSKDLIELGKLYTEQFEEPNIQLVFVNMDEYFFLSD